MVIFILSITTYVQGQSTEIQSSGAEDTTTIHYSIITQITYVPLNNTYAVIVEKYLNNGTIITIYENGNSISLYCENISIGNITHITFPQFKYVSNASSMVINIHTKLFEYNLPPIGIFVYKDYIIVEFSPYSSYFKFYVFNSKLIEINQFTLFTKNNIKNEGILGISGKYLLYYKGKITYKNITIEGNNTGSFLNSLLLPQIIFFTTKNTTSLIATIPEISNITVYMYNLLNGNIENNIYLRNVTIYEYPSLVLVHNISAITANGVFLYTSQELIPAIVQGVMSVNGETLNCTLTTSLSDFIYKEKILDLETLCYNNFSIVNKRFYVVNLYNGKVNLSPKYNILEQIIYCNDLIVVKKNIIYFFPFSIYKNTYLYTPNFTFLGKTSFIPAQPINTIFINMPPSYMVPYIVPRISQIFSSYNPETNYIYYHGYIYLSNYLDTLIIHNNRSIQLNNTMLYFFGKPILIEKELGGYKVMELNGDKILKYVYVKANNFSTWNTITINKGEIINQNENSTTNVTYFTDTVFLGVGDFIIFHDNNTNILLELSNLTAINLFNTNLIGVYKTNLILVNEKNLQLANNYSLTNNLIYNNININIKTFSDLTNYSLFLIPLSVAIIIIGLLRLRKIL
uniref:Thermopsin n=2 Tax=Acidianus brierleyi TaxID=41673 RepID=A0A2U9IIA7_9CREN